MIDNRENNIWTVYVHIVPKAITKYDYDKYYVGITKQSIIRRWRNNGMGYYSQPFYKAIKKYGWDNIEHYVIAEHLTEHEAQEFEKTLIKNLGCNINKDKFGYNVSDGGDIRTGYKHSEETRRKISESNKGKPYTNPWNKISSERKEEIKQMMHTKFLGENNPRYGKHCTQETKEKISKSKLGKKMINSIQCVETYQFDLDGNFINKYYSAKEAERQTNLKASNIRNCLNNKQYSYGDYIWRKKEDVIIKNNTYIPINLIEKPKYNRKIYQFDLYGNCMYVYKKLNDVLKSNKNYKIENIIHCLHHINKTAYNYIWIYEEELCIIDGKPQLKEINLQRKKHKIHENPKYIIYQFDINGNFIKKYLNCKHASKEVFVDNSSIAKVARKVKKTAGNYIWRYEKDVGFDENGKICFIE